MNILFIVENLSRGGTERHLRELLPALRTAGLKLQVWYTGQIGEAFDTLVRHDIKPVHVPRRLLFIKLIIHLLSKLRNKPLIHSYLYADHIIDAIIARIFGVIYVKSTRNQGHWRKTKNGILTLVKILIRKLVVPYHLTNSAEVKNYLITNEFVSGDKITIINNGVIDLYGQKNSLSRETIHVGTDDFIFISVARLKEFKRIELMLDVIVYLQKDFNNLRLLILGDGPSRSKIENILSTRGLANSCHLLGWQSEPFYFLSLSDALLHFSETEGMSNTIIEAMMAGLPVVGFKGVGGNSELIENNTNGILCDTCCVTDIAERLKPLITSKTLKTNMGRTARQRCLDKFTFTKQLHAFIEFYKTIDSTRKPSK